MLQRVTEIYKTKYKFSLLGWNMLTYGMRETEVRALVAFSCQFRSWGKIVRPCGLNKEFTGIGNTVTEI